MDWLHRLLHWLAGRRPRAYRDWPASAAPENAPTRPDATTEELAQVRRDNKLAQRLRRYSRNRERLRGLIGPGSTLFVLLAVAAGASAFLEEREVPSKSFWRHDAPHLAITVVEVVGLLVSALLVEEYRRLRARRESDNRLHDLARSIGRNVAASLPIDIDELSVHIWRVREARKILPWRPRLAYLERQAAFIPERREHEEFAWLRGRGVVGRCWMRRRELVLDLEQELYAYAPDATTFYDRAYDDRFRMTFAQVWNTRHFKAVWAYPLFIGPVAAPRFAGCVSIDVRKSGYAPALRHLADNRSHDLNSLLADCAAALRAEL